MTFRERYTILEAIPLKDAKSLSLRASSSPNYNEKFDSIFGDKHRISIQFAVDVVDVLSKQINPLYSKINDYIQSISIDNKGTRLAIRSKRDYIRGLCYSVKDAEKKQPYKIGKILNRDESSRDLLEAFRDDPLRNEKSTKDSKIIISRHPYDIARQSTDRNWTSCMDLGTPRINYKNKPANIGLRNSYVSQDIRYGTLVAYLVNGTDNNLQKPLARVSIKPWISGDSVKYTVEDTYGINYQPFRGAVITWVDENLNTEIDADKEYQLHPALYNNDD